MRSPGTINAFRQAISVISFLSAFILTPSSHAQELPKRLAACQTIIDAIVKDGVAPTNFADLRGGSVICFWELALVNVANTDARHAQAAIQKHSNTVQTGAPSGGSGTTSAVSKPISPLSLATEYGGITTSSSNQTITIQAPLDGIPAGLAAKGLVGYCWSPLIEIPGCVSASKLQWLNRFSVGVSANTTSSSQGVSGAASASTTTVQPASLTRAGTTSPSIASTFAKFNLIRGGGALTVPSGLKQSGTAVNDAQEHIIQALNKLGGGMQNGRTDYDSWQSCILTQFTKDRIPTPVAQSSQFFKYWAQIVPVLFDKNRPSMNCQPDAPVLSQHDIDQAAPTPAQLDQWRKQFANKDQQSADPLNYARLQLTNAVDEYIAAAQVFEAQTDQLIKSLAPVLSFEYDYNTPVNQPTTSTAKLLLSYSWRKLKCSSGSSSGDSTSTSTVDRFTTTVNVGGNFYNSAPSSVPSAGAFRDAQAGSEFDVAMCPQIKQPILSYLTNATIGLTYYYQDQVSPSILKVASAGMPLPGINITGLSSSATQVFTKKGPINFVQLKYGLGFGKNVKFPIAISWSNRTDLMTHALWSAQFGVSYDFSSLLNSSSGSGTSPSK
jgi:hypothetical protein